MAGISKEAIDAVLQPVGDARGLPNEAYTDAQAYLDERDAVLSESWAGIAFASELPAPGYVKPVDFMGFPLLVVRGKDDEIRVFHNVCSHRGMLLVDKPAAYKAVIRCPYHSWSYDDDGTLKSTPHVGGVDKHDCEGFDRSKYGLRRIRSGVWMDTVFVNLSGTAELFDDFIGPVVRRWESFTGIGGFDNVFVAETGSHLDLPVNCNWKLPVENYCESYHLPWVHPGLNTYSPLNMHYSIIDGENMSGQGTLNYTPTLAGDESLPQFSDWPNEKIKHAEYISLYPNVLLGLQADHVYAIILLPQGPDRTLEKLQICYIGEESIGDQFREVRDAVLKAWKEVFMEDVFAVERMQKGRASPGFDGGVFTPIQDVPTHHFHSWTARKYQSSK